MYAFGMMALLGLAALLVARLAGRYLSLAQEYWVLALLALGVGTAWLTDFSVFAAWALPVRNADIGLTMTGFAIAGVGFFWRVVLDFLSGVGRKFKDQAVAIEKDQHLRSAA